ncbi:hypothetical protein GWK47_014296 [Chionoecetes opilio]|uniref:Uncharacterized protein n=1 Tax=Chionoecetes opilio TaxID=41210 RepID=A0A8J4XTD6_CHIOP|nr:hypothetical protein GWK47_014296 [Chionoecetes opilio]
MAIFRRGAIVLGEGLPVPMKGDRTSLFPFRRDSGFSTSSWGSWPSKLAVAAKISKGLAVLTQFFCQGLRRDQGIGGKFGPGPNRFGGEAPPGVEEEAMFWAPALADLMLRHDARSTISSPFLASLTAT